MGKKILKIGLRIIIALLAIATIIVLFYTVSTEIDEPQINVQKLKESKRIEVNDSTFTFNNSILRKNSYGIWEMYLEGNAEEIGYSHGILSRELMHFQEDAFVSQIKKMIPNEKYLNFLKYITAIMNRNLTDYIPLEYQKEIKAVSLFADDQFDFIGDNYARQLNYHAAHDIGHAMQNLNLVACTAFSVWDSLSVDSSLLIARNFDFYVGDDFAKNKVIMFIAPEQGYKFVSYSWAGMSGVVSGMNNQGLSISLNAAKSEIPFTAKTPVSIIAREILQYASNIEEAYEIAKKRPSFVAESFFIGSAKENQTAIIEKTPDSTILFRAKGVAKQIVTNHFQSPELINAKLNQENLNTNATGKRFERVEELLNSKAIHGLKDFVSILRNPYGQNNAEIGLGNELAMNQFVAHHAIVFKPQYNKLWISSPPFQLGEFIPYDLEEVFENPESLFKENFANNLLAADTVQMRSTYANFVVYKQIQEQILVAIKNKKVLDKEMLLQFQEANPQFFYTWEILGDYYLETKAIELATEAYTKSLDCVIPNIYEHNRVKEKRAQLENNAN